jgi:hypothetical protein
MNFHSHPDFTYNPGVLICFKIERDSAMIECKAYNILLSRIRFWKLATTTYREVNAFLFVGAKVFVPVLSAIVAGNLAMAVRGNPIVSNEFMFWASVAILVLSSLDTFLNPREKKSVAFETNWPAPGSEDTELGVLMELEVRHGEAEVYAGVQA